MTHRETGKNVSFAEDRSHEEAGRSRSQSPARRHIIWESDEEGLGKPTVSSAMDVEDEGTRMAFLQAIQYDALSGKALHADFLAIDEKTAITAHVPSHPVGDAPGVKTGGVIEQYVHAIEVNCLPNDLPEMIDLDVTSLELGDSLHLGDIKYPKGVTPTGADDVVVIHIGRAGAAPEEEEATEEEATEEVAAEAPAE